MKDRRAVLVELEKRNGVLQVRLHDVIQQDEKGMYWVKSGLITEKDYESRIFEEMAFEEKELADFGHYIMARLMAFWKRGKL